MLEVSVVSVPANAAATFSLKKSFNSEQEYNDYVKTFKTGLAELDESIDESTSGTPEEPEQVQETTKEINMDSKELEALVAAAAQKGAEDAAAKIRQEQAEKEARILAEQKALEEEARKEAEIEERVRVSVETAVERIQKEFESKLPELAKVEPEKVDDELGELKKALQDKQEELRAMRESKRSFTDRANGGNWEKTFEKDIVHGHLLGKITKKGWDTEFGKDLIEKVNAHSGVAVSSADFEQIVSTSVERDIQEELVLAPLFREIQMNAASMIIPILPDAGYAEFISAAGTGPSSAPHGNLEERSDTVGSPFAGIDLTEKTLTVKKLVSKSYLGNETEEDAIMPIMPLIQESMVRSHARAVESSILMGGIESAAGSPAASPYGPVRGVDALTPGWNGLVRLAFDDGKEFDAGASTDNIVTLDLFKMRKEMGVYGVRPQDVVYIISREAYYELIEDADFHDVNQVGANVATKLKGEVANIWGSAVLVCDEFSSHSAFTAWGIAVNPRNFVIPRLRGLRIEQEYSVADQNTVLVASQRYGFDQIHSTAGQVVNGYFSS